MAKAPVPGQVKTRLCPPLDPQMAADLHRSLVIDTIERLGALPGIELVVAYSSPDGSAFFRDIVPPGTHCDPQRGRDHGERMYRCFEEHCRPGVAVVVVGSDSPTLPLRYIEDAYRLLETGSAKAVFGPSDDGGYYLVGLISPHPHLFRGIEWSTDRVLEQSLERACELGIKPGLLPEWYDVDTPADLARLALELSLCEEDEDHPAPNTAGFLWRLTERGQVRTVGADRLVPSIP